MKGASSVAEESASLLVIKIGGSLFSDKRQARTVDADALREYASAIAQLCDLAPGQIILVSGGGAFGHDAVRALDPADPHAALSLTEATFALKWLWTEALRSFGCRAVPLQIAALAHQEEGRVHMQGRVIQRLLDSNVLPVLSGDVTIAADGSLKVFGSDRVPELLLGVRPGAVRVAMLTDVPGILLDGPNGAETLRTVDADSPEVALNAMWRAPEWDSSSSMAGKLNAALAIAAEGAECFILKGEPSVAYMQRLLHPCEVWPSDMRYTRIESTRSIARSWPRRGSRAMKARATRINEEQEQPARPGEALSRLTALPEKAQRYLDEAFFRESWRDIAAAAGDQAQELVQRHALILFKPDGIAGRAVRPGLELLEERGFVPVGGAMVELDSSLTRWLWLYRFNIASVERVWLHDLINSRSSSLLVVLRDELAVSGQNIPATVRLTDQKGPSKPERRRPDQLRARLGVSDRLINFVHTSDEPADLVREMGILLDPTTRRALIEQMLQGKAWPPSLVERASTLEETVPTQSFELPIAIAGIRRAAQGLARKAEAGATKDQWAALAEIASTVLSGDTTALPSLWLQLRDHIDLFDPWDVIVVGTQAIDHDEVGITRQTLGDAPPELWLDHLVTEEGRAEPNQSLSLGETVADRS